jgi:TolB-like protein
MGFAGPALAGDYAVTSGQGYSFPHQVPADYVYRTGRVYVPEENGGGWWPDLRGLFARQPAAEHEPLIPAEQAMELKLKVRELAQQLLDHSLEPIGEQSRLIVTTFVNLNRLYKTSGLGRAMAEQMISELQRAGIEVIDVRMTPSIQIEEGFGEYGLSRDMAQLSYTHDAQAVVVGTYTVSAGQVMINARLLQQGDGLVLSSGSIVFPANRLVQGFLRDEAMPPVRGTMVELRSFSDIAPTK